MIDVVYSFIFKVVGLTFMALYVIAVISQGSNPDNFLVFIAAIIALIHSKQYSNSN